MKEHQSHIQIHGHVWLNDECCVVRMVFTDDLEDIYKVHVVRLYDGASFSVDPDRLGHSPSWVATPMYPQVKVKLLRPSAKVPQYMTDGAAGADVFADLEPADPLYPERDPVEERELCMDEPGVYKVPLGIALEIPPGWVGLLKDRSGNYLKGVDGHVAALDSDYRGEICMLLRTDDLGDLVTIRHGDRVGQILFVPVGRAQFKITDELSETARGTGGLGSTGTR